MKVLQIINNLDTGGAEKLIIETVTLMNQRGINCDVLVFNNNNFPFHSILENRNCCEIINLELSSVYDVKAILKLRKVLPQYDIVHVHLFPAQYFTILANMISFDKSPKFVFTEHNVTNNRKTNRLLAVFDKLTYKGYHKIVCISDEINEITEDYLGDKSKLTVVENGINLDAIYDATPLSRNSIDSTIKEEDVLIFQVSTFDRAKDQPTLIKSLKYLPKKYKLVFAGNGVKIDESKDLAKEMGVSDRVIFLGVRKDIPKLLKTVDYVALSSEHEGLSLASLEGLASGKPFICTEVPGLIDVVKGAGVMFPYKDAKAFADEILKLENNESYHQKIVNKCLERASFYDVKNMTSRLVDIYKELVTSK